MKSIYNALFEWSLSYSPAAFLLWLIAKTWRSQSLYGVTADDIPGIERAAAILFLWACVGLALAVVLRVAHWAWFRLRQKP